MRTYSKEITVQKENGRFYTPDFIVDTILNLSGYCGEQLLKKHAIDNSCGDGAFLRRMVRRYCEEALKIKTDLQSLKKELETYIHGIEIEATEHQKCIESMSDVAAEFGVSDVKWDVICADALNITKYDGMMRYVLGNPPYVRVHNLAESAEVKKFSFSQNGMTDLFIVFYELGIRMLDENGVLGYITPSSYFNSVAGAYMRKYLSDSNLLKTVVDLQHFQAFSATTYTAITILQNGRSDSGMDYYRFDAAKKMPCYVDTLQPSDYGISGDFCFATKSELENMRRIYCNSGKSDISVKNGYATLCDPVFIHDFEFESKYVIPVIKASKGSEKKIFFPYNENGVLVDEEALKKDLPLYDYLISNKERLVKRSNEKDAEKYWYAFGRSQAINDTFRDKLSINSLLRDENDFKFVKAPAGTGVYGGLYITSDTVPCEEIINALKTKEFISYVTLLGKYKSGGYYTFSSKDVKRFLDYKFAYNGGLSCWITDNS